MNIFVKVIDNINYVDIIPNINFDFIPIVKSHTLRVFRVGFPMLIYGKDYFLSSPNRIVFTSLLNIGDKVAVLYEDEERYSATVFDDFVFNNEPVELTRSPSKLSTIIIEYDGLTYFVNDSFNITNGPSTLVEITSIPISNGQFFRVHYDVDNLDIHKIQEVTNLAIHNYDENRKILTSKVDGNASIFGKIDGVPGLVREISYLRDFDVIDNLSDKPFATWDGFDLEPLLTFSPLVEYILSDNINDSSPNGYNLVGSPTFQNLYVLPNGVISYVENSFDNYLYRSELDIDISKDTKLAISGWMNIENSVTTSILAKWGTSDAEFKLLIDRQIGKNEFAHFIVLYSYWESGTLNHVKKYVDISNVFRPNTWTHYEIQKDGIDFIFKINGYDILGKDGFIDLVWKPIQEIKFTSRNLSNKKLNIQYMYDYIWLENLQSRFVFAYIYDNTNKLVDVLNFKSVDNFMGILDLDGYTIVGTWKIIIRQLLPNIEVANYQFSLPVDSGDIIGGSINVTHPLNSQNVWAYVYDNEYNMKNIKFEIIDNSNVLLDVSDLTIIDSWFVVITPFEYREVGQPLRSNIYTEQFTTHDIFNSPILSIDHSIGYEYPFIGLLENNKSVAINSYIAKSIDENSTTLDVSELIKIDRDFHLYEECFKREDLNIDYVSDPKGNVKTITITHNLNTNDIIAYVYDNKSDLLQVSYEIININTIEVDISGFMVDGVWKVVCLKPKDYYSLNFGAAQISDVHLVDIEHNLNSVYLNVYLRMGTEFVKSTSWISIDENRGVLDISGYEEFDIVGGWNVIIVNDQYTAGELVSGDIIVNNTTTYTNEFNNSSIQSNQTLIVEHNLNTNSPLVYLYSSDMEYYELTNYTVLNHNKGILNLGGLPIGNENWTVIVKAPIEIIENANWKVLVAPGNPEKTLELENVTKSTNQPFILGRSGYNQGNTNISQFKIFELRIDIFNILYHSPGLIRGDDYNVMLKFANENDSGLCPKLVDIIEDIEFASKSNVPSERAIRKAFTHLDINNVIKIGDGNKDNVGFFAGSNDITNNKSEVKQDYFDSSKYNVLDWKENIQQIQFRGIETVGPFLDISNEPDKIVINAMVEPDLEVDCDSFVRSVVQGGLNTITKRILENENTLDGITICQLQPNTIINKVFVYVNQRLTKYGSLYSIGSENNQELVTKQFRVDSVFGEVYRIALSNEFIKNDGLRINEQTSIKLFSDNNINVGNGEIVVELMVTPPINNYSNIYLMGSNDLITKVNIANSVQTVNMFSSNLNMESYQSAIFNTQIISPNSNGKYTIFRINLDMLENINVSKGTRKYSNINIINNMLYEMGGEITTEVSERSFIRMNLNNHTHIIRPIELPITRATSFTTSSKKIVYIGGLDKEIQDDNEYTISNPNVNIFDTVTETFSNMPELQISRSRASTLKISDDKFYVVGGEQIDQLERTRLNTIELININNSTESVPTIFRYPIAGAIGTSDGVKGYISCGDIGENFSGSTLSSKYQLEVNFATDTWQVSNVKISTDQFDCGGITR